MNRLERLKIRRDSLKGGKRTYKGIKYPSIPISSSDAYIIAKVGDRLDTMAYDFYKDSRLWWIISRANPNKIKRDSFFINPGLRIRIPIDINRIKDEYENLNF